MRPKIFAEFFGTAGLLVVVVGSGIMGEALAQGNSAIALLANSIATAAGLYTLIQTFAPISGAHFNPAVSFVEWLGKKLSTKELGQYASAQILGGVAGVVVTHLIFGQSLMQISTKNRGELHLMFSEVIATFGLVIVIALADKKNMDKIPISVALYILAAYWCTSSTSFANPAVTIARSFTNTFTGIQWTGAPAFIAAQFIGAGLAFVTVRRLVIAK